MTRGKLYKALVSECLDYKQKNPTRWPGQRDMATDRTVAGHCLQYDDPLQVCAQLIRLPDCINRSTVAELISQAIQ